MAYEVPPPEKRPEPGFDAPQARRKRVIHKLGDCTPIRSAGPAITRRITAAHRWRVHAGLRPLYEAAYAYRRGWIVRRLRPLEINFYKPANARRGEEVSRAADHRPWGDRSAVGDQRLASGSRQGRRSNFAWIADPSSPLEVTHRDIAGIRGNCAGPARRDRHDRVVFLDDAGSGMRRLEGAAVDDPRLQPSPAAAPK